MIVFFPRVSSTKHKALIKEYLAADGAAKQLLEKRYGKKHLAVITNEFLSEEYKQKNSKRCPNCSAPIEKTEGCNKMTCNK